MNLPTREEYEFLRFKFTQDIAHGSPSERFVVTHNFIHIIALYASSDEHEEIFPSRYWKNFCRSIVNPYMFLLTTISQLNH